MRSKILALAGAIAGLLCLHCGSAPTPSDAVGTSDGAYSSAPASHYGVTTFGGPGDYQSFACGGSSQSAQTSQPYYSASSQRYGCKAHVKITAPNGKCVVVVAMDVGPASFVENHAGMPVLDVGPAVAQYLFGTTGLGWSDVKNHPGKYEVQAAKTTDAPGPCSGSTNDDTDPPAPTTSSSGSTGGSSGDGGDDGTSSSSSSSSGSSGGSSSGGSSSGGGTTCSTDGECNPGNNGSGLICEGGECVPGCHTDAQCPGVQFCNDSGECE